MVPAWRESWASLAFLANSAWARRACARVDALLLHPQEQGEGAEQGGAVQHLAQKAHALASAQLACCS